MNNIERITEKLKNGEYTSHTAQDCADDLAKLSGEYSWVCSQLEQVLASKPVIWNSIRKNTKSDTSAERQWEASENGVNEMGLRLRMKSIEKMMSALKSIINVAQNELLRTK